MVLDRGKYDWNHNATNCKVKIWKKKTEKKKHALTCFR